MIITSNNNPTIKKINSLKKKKNRDESQLYLIEGRHMVDEAIKEGIVETVISTNQEIKANIYVNDSIMKKLAFTSSPQDVMAVCRKKENKLNKKAKRTLILDGLQDPGNVGTLLRTALAFNYDQVIISKDSVDLYNDKVLRATQGAILRLNIVVDDLHKVIPLLKENKIKVIGTTLRNASSIEDIHEEDYMAFVLGNEGNGMHEDIIDLCDQTLYIPIGDMESLNVGIAGGIVMYTYRG